MNAREYISVLSKLADIVDEGVHIVGRDGRSIVYNEVMSKLEEIEPKEVLGKHFRQVFSSIPEEESTLLRALSGVATAESRQTYRNKFGKEITTLNATTPVIVHGEVLAAIEIAKDITHIKDMSEAILELQGAGQSRKKSAIKHYEFSDLIGESPEFKRLTELAKKASESAASVLISGETGTGKELFAQSIHYADPRRSGRPFLAQNCAALPEALLEGLLFGTSRGGFTGAVDRAGLFEQASGGTLLLDEISAMPYELQSKLLRVLQESYIRRVGGTRDIPVDVRIIATINEPAAELIESGRLRKDLYYRLAIINLDILPLRERKSDIPLLAQSFLLKYNTKYGKEIWMISQKAAELLRKYDYPGNVRELENIIMAAVSLAGANDHALTKELLEEVFPTFSEVGRGTVGGGAHAARADGYRIGEESLEEYLESIERAAIQRALSENGKNVSKACVSLGMKRQTLQYKIKKYGLELQEL